MENRIGEAFIFTIITAFFVTGSCNHKTCTNLEIPMNKECLDTLSKRCNFIKRCSGKEIYLINPTDSNFVYDIDTLFYYKENNSRYVIVFNSSVFMEKYFIAIIQNERLEVYPCANLFKICEIHYPNKLIIEMHDSLLQFNTLSYGLHTLELLNKGDSVLYHYTDTIIYDDNY